MTKEALVTDAAPTPKGICGVITTPDGHVVATFADFDPFRPGGMNLINCQKSRVRAGLVRVFVRRHLTDRLTAKVDEYFADAFWRNAESHGYHMTLLPVGWPDAEVGP